MVGFISDPREWAEVHFAGAELGDKRRSERLIKVAANMAAHPSGGIPSQGETWADAKAAYRLFDQEDVTFFAVSAPHRQSCQNSGPGKYLIISDTSELDFTGRQIDNLGHTANGKGYGFLLHSALLVHADTKSLFGVIGHKLWCRSAKKKLTRTQKLALGRESEVWGEVIDQVGPPPEGAQWIHVQDRGADNFEVFCHAQDQRTDWVIRAGRLQRRIETEAGEAMSLREWVDVQPVMGHYPLKVPARAKTRREPARAARTATMAVSWGKVIVPVPHMRSPYLKNRGNQAITMYVVVSREVDPPPGEEPIEWVLYTSLPVACLADALQVLEYYQARWIVEEWHKTLKSGCRVTERQLRTRDRLEPLIALLSVESVRLVQLKTMARVDPDRPALEVVPRPYLEMVQRARGKAGETWSVRTFFRAVAQLGGFLGRKSDGEPGWQTTWRGWEKLALMIRGSALAHGIQQLNCG